MSEIFLRYLSSRCDEEEKTYDLHLRIKECDAICNKIAAVIRILRWCHDMFDRNRSLFNAFDTKCEFLQFLDVDESHDESCVELCNEIWDNLKAAKI